MKALRKIQTTPGVPREIELYDPRLDNLIRIENQFVGVKIRAARDGISPGARDSFIRYLANEGFIAESYGRTSQGAERDTPSIQWVTDGSWVRFRHRRIRMTTRIWAFLTWGRLLVIGLFPLALAATIWFKHH